MIKELVQFTQAALVDPVFSNLGVTPREGLHIVLQVVKTPEQTMIAEKPLFAGVYSKKMKSWDAKIDDCAAWSQVAWMIDTNKCFDPTVKAIHSCSPFCFALKRTNLEGGEQYAFNQKENKSQVYERINLYFSKAVALLESPEEKAIAEAFRVALNDRTRLHNWLEGTGLFKDVKDGEYVIFYLDLPVEKYAAANQKYKKEKLFNTSDFNAPDPYNPELIHGTSNWFNGFPAKKPFLQHQSAMFNISGRITSDEARLLDAFSDLNRRKVFPNPLPIFIYEDERETAFKIFKADAQSGEEKRKGYLEVIAEMWSDRNLQHQELGNYYLLFTLAGEIRDFDFVSRFEYELRDENGKPWEIKDIFKYKDSRTETLESISQLAAILPDFFNTKMVHRWFEDLDTKFFTKRNNYQLTMKHRNAFYSFIYKSQRQGVVQQAIEEILLTGILDDIANDKQEKESFNIRRKLNLLFSLHQYFYPKIKDPFFMTTKIEELRQHLNEVAEGKAHITKDDQFAFAAGQMLARIYMQSETADRSFKFAEPFLRQTRADRFVKGIQDFFVRYSHKPYANRFTTASAEVLTYPSKNEIRDFENLKPLVLAGIFFKRNLLLSDKEKTNEDGTQVVE